ncbi:hypothetical protein [Myroides injenensis]|uniref:hypothetical protein n=1 Tax=Myroides injenensis TaxID=1183151 RepID=UPI000289EC4C|nr:hypothetical protein [Myroides injenensis]
MKSLKGFFLIIALLFSFGQVFAQPNTKIKDGSVANSSQTPSVNAILELESTGKGFLLPRLTNKQRDDIANGANNLEDGLTIYNVDTDCINYWSKMNDMWMSLCGTLPPANVKVDSNICSTISFSGQLIQGQPLDESRDFLSITLDVTTIGDYNIDVVTDNGYYFSTSGTFMSTGPVTIKLKGFGVPAVGYSDQITSSVVNTTIGDKIILVVNGKRENICNTTMLNVIKAPISFTLDCTSYKISDQPYLIGQTVDQNKHYVDIDVNVTNKGIYRIQSNQVNGISFKGTGTLKNTGVNTVRLYAEGKPIAEGNYPFTVTTNSDGGGNECSFTINVKGVDYEVDLSKSKYLGTYTQNTKLTSANKLEVEVLVKSPGKASFKVIATDNDLVEFTATDVVLNYRGENGNNIQKVLLNSNNQILPNKDKITLTGDGNLKIINSFEIPLKVQYAQFSIQCSKVKVNGTMVPDMAANGKITVDVPVKVLSAGSYSIKTANVNGVQFSKSGSFTADQVGKEVIVTLSADGVPIKASAQTVYQILTENNDNTGSCSFKTEAQFDEVNILVIGDVSGEFGPSTNPAIPAGAILTNPSNFGPNGTVKSSKINVYYYFDFYRDNSKLNIIPKGSSPKLQKLINDKKIDAIFFTQQAVVSNDRAWYDVLFDFVRNQRGVLVYSNSNDLYSSSTLVNRITGSNFGAGDFASPVYSGASVRVNAFRMLNIPDNPIINGPFRNIAGATMGIHLNGTYYKRIPSNMHSIAEVDISSKDMSIILQHNTDAFLMIGDGGWMGGYFSDQTDRFLNSNPLSSTRAGILEITKEYGLDGRNVTQRRDAYNSYLYANIMAWTIKWVNENRR